MKNYQTKDFYLSSFLLASGFRLAGHLKQAGLTIFQFDDSSELNNHIEKYYGFTANVNPITFGNAMRTLKSIIHANTNENEQYHSQLRKVN
jgi:hypothetical protein